MWAPTASRLVAVDVATPAVSAAGPPRFAPSTPNWMEPVGVPWVPVRVATNCTGWPKTDGVTVEVTALVGAICPTDWLRTSEVLAVKSAVPP